MAITVAVTAAQRRRGVRVELFVLCTPVASIPGVLPSVLPLPVRC
ncbi:hypothetical protein ABZ924_21705 [Streptomyces sp. NPDC046876]